MSAQGDPVDLVDVALDARTKECCVLVCPGCRDRLPFVRGYMAHRVQSSGPGDWSSSFSCKAFAIRGKFHLGNNDVREKGVGDG